MLLHADEKEEEEGGDALRLVAVLARDVQVRPASVDLTYIWGI